MAGIQEGVKTEQAADASGVVENASTGVSQETAPDKSVQVDPAVVQQEASQAAQGTEQVLADGTPVDKPVEYTRFKEVNDAKKELADRVAQLEQHIQLQKANPQQVEQTETQQKSLTLQVMQELKIDPEDLMTGAQQAQVNDIVIQRMTSANQSQMQLQSFIASKPDYAKVVGQADAVTGQFVVAAPLQRAINNNPSIAVALRSAGANASVLAYELASKDPQYLKEVADAAKPVVQKENELAQQIIKQANTQVSISAVAGVGNLDKAAAIRAMSDAEFEVHKQQIMKQAT